MRRNKNSKLNSVLSNLIFSLGLGAGFILAACSGGNGALASADPGSTPTPGTPGATDIAAWGDSTTAGIGSSAGMSYPEQLQSLTGRRVFNAGVSGQTSEQIAARQGGSPALLTFPNNTLPASGSVVIADQSTFPVSADGPGSITGSVQGIRGTLNYQAGTNPRLGFTREASGSATAIPPQTAFIPDTFGRESQINLFWMGQNNFYAPSQVQADIAKCVAFLSTQKFIVLSILNAENEGVGTTAYNTITQLNSQLAQAYPNNYIDIRKILVNAYDPGNAQDVRDYNNDTPPASLRNDNEHLNDAGYRIVAQSVAEFIAARNW